MKILDIYELYYNNVMLSNTDDEWEIVVSPETIVDVHKALKEISRNESEDMNEIVFSDVTYDKIPFIDGKDNKITTDYIPIFADTKTKGNPKEQMERFKAFDITKLPLLDVVKYMDLKIEKSNQIKPYGLYRHSERKIILGSDYVPTFLHELAHAIDRILPDYDYDEDYDFHEVIAEVSAVVIAKKYNIPVNLPYSIHYLEGYDAPISKKDKSIKRIREILEYIKQVKEYLKNR